MKLVTVSCSFLWKATDHHTLVSTMDHQHFLFASASELPDLFVANPSEHISKEWPSNYNFKRRRIIRGVMESSYYEDKR